MNKYMFFLVASVSFSGVLYATEDENTSLLDKPKPVVKKINQLKKKASSELKGQACDQTELNEGNKSMLLALIAKASKSY